MTIDEINASIAEQADQAAANAASIVGTAEHTAKDIRLAPGAVGHQGRRLAPF